MLLGGELCHLVDMEIISEMIVRTFKHQNSRPQFSIQPYMEMAQRIEESFLCGEQGGAMHSAIAQGFSSLGLLY